ncbi:chromosome partitioning protein ParA [uncultured Eubacterium sp.]|mgnify:FL=1|uniref:chromosome partitioning protein ParA n=1 Tax=uncultured Eubacterium sp. TaxID=165185 RepID=UPI002594FD96|nr:chromosome partitioning protein ParA [uncultured Eubacterium sp.]
MKIKLAILDKDKSYLNRIVTVFEVKYADKFEVYSFTDLSVAIQTLSEVKIDVLIANDAFDVDVAKLPKRCGFAYFVDSPDIDMLNNQRTICKFQKADLIYKQIISIYSENAGNITGLKISDDSCKLIAFTSPCGGTGNSTMAAACALHFAGQGKKTLYLNLEKYGSSDSFFSAEGQFDMSDIIFALKSKKANLSLKLESSVKQDNSGVYFYSQTKVALDMLELSADDILHLISELKLTGSYDYIVLDMEFELDKGYLDIYRKINSIIVVGDGSEISNLKIFRGYNAIVTKEQESDSSIANRIVLMYNKFSNKSSRALDDIELKSIGGAPRYEHATTRQVLSQLSNLSVFDDIASV